MKWPIYLIKFSSIVVLRLGKGFVIHHEIRPDCIRRKNSTPIFTDVFHLHFLLQLERKTFILGSFENLEARDNCTTIWNVFGELSRTSVKVPVSVFGGQNSIFEYSHPEVLCTGLRSYARARVIFFLWLTSKVRYWNISSKHKSGKYSQSTTYLAWLFLITFPFALFLCNHNLFFLTFLDSLLLLLSDLIRSSALLTQSLLAGTFIKFNVFLGAAM